MQGGVGARRPEVGRETPSSTRRSSRILLTHILRVTCPNVHYMRPSSQFHGGTLTCDEMVALHRVVHLHPTSGHDAGTWGAAAAKAKGGAESEKKRERERECVCVRERDSVCACVRVCVRVCERERQRERERLCARERESARVCVRVCMCVRESERERERRRAGEYLVQLRAGLSHPGVAREHGCV